MSDATGSPMCMVDADCSVVYTISGLTEIPSDPATVTCEARCFTAVGAGEVTAWNEAKRRLEPLIACDKKREECPDLQTRTAACRSGRCVVTNPM